MSFPNRGKALIINNKNFVQLNDREGTDVDANALRQIFLEIGFNVEVCNNLAAYNMLEKLRHGELPIQNRHVLQMKHIDYKEGCIDR